MARILVVDDRPINRQFLSTLLGYAGHEIMEAGNGREALERLEPVLPDLVITDLLMPEVDGYELVQKLKADPATAGIPVIIYTATYRIPEARMLAKGCGAAGVLPKPSEPQDVLALVNSTLGIAAEGPHPPPPVAPGPFSIGEKLNLLGDTAADLQHEMEALRALLDNVIERSARLSAERTTLKDIAHRYAENLTHLHAVSGRLGALLEVSLDLLQQTDPKAMLELLFEAASRIIRSGCINMMIQDSRAPQDRWMRCRGVSDAQLEEMANCETMPGLPGRVLAEHRTLRVSASGGGALPAEEFPSAHPPVGSFLGVPMIGRVDSYGALFFANPPGEEHFSDEDERVAQTLAAIGAITYENALLYGDVQRSAASLRIEVAERQKAEATLAASERKFRSMIEGVSDLIATVTPEGVFLYASPSIAGLGGYEPAELLGRSFLELVNPEDLPRAAAVMREIVASPGVPVRAELRYRHKDGRWLVVETQSKNLLHDAAVEAIVVTARDMSDRREQEQRILRLSRAQAVLSGINGLIVRARDRQELFEGACQIAVEKGGFLLAWIGRADASGMMKPVAFHGRDDGYMSEAGFSLDPEGLYGKGATAAALRVGKAFVSEDIAQDPAMAACREAALKNGFRTAAAVPFKLRGSVAGCLCLYSSEMGTFDAEEIALLEELADDIAYALEFILQKEESDYLVYFDPLTGLANRSLFTERVEEHLKTARAVTRKVAVALVDVDNFKAINDSLGQATGDALLKAVAERLTRVAGSPSFLARFNADRFAVVMPNLHEVADLAPLIRESLIKRMSRPFDLSGKDVRVTGKAGLALFPDDGDGADILIRNAESAMKTAKQRGETVVFYTRQMGEAISTRLGMEERLRRAVENDEFVLHYQPKVDLRGGTLCGAEALIRWNSPELGLVPPARFIALLEETGMIVEVGRWALRQAVEDRRRWQQQGLSAPRVAVNVSSRQLKQPDFVEVVCAEVITPGERAPGIDLEVTESMLMGDVEAAIASLGTLREKGINIAIDDFGTGYSSLSYLARLPVSAVKIDRSFIIKMAESADTMSIVSTIITLAHSMNLEVVAEGVDTAEQLKFLRLLKCDEIQGFLYSAPLTADGFAALLKEGRRLA